MHTTKPASKNLSQSQMRKNLKSNFEHFGINRQETNAVGLYHHDIYSSNGTHEVILNKLPKSHKNRD